jgi:hypothetical protein
MARESTMDAWLESIGFSQYGAAFADNDVDLEIAPELADEGLKELGLSLGQRNPQPQFRANALVARGDALAMSGDKDAAISDYVAAAEAAAAQGAAGEHLHALLHNARLINQSPGFDDIAQEIGVVLAQIGDETHPEVTEARDLVAAP